MEGKLTYKDAGVDTKEGEHAVKLMKEHVKKTFDKGVLSGIGGFGSLYMPDLTGVSAPVLVAGSDGVGTKLMIAFKMDKHDTVGQDCVAMCVNDILVLGAQPLFFLDYMVMGKLFADKGIDIVSGIAEGCRQAQCALIGGETAEMPGLYKVGDYDLAGFAVGVVDKDKIIDGSRVENGDTLIALPSSGLHSNGFSLVRKVFDVEGSDLRRYVEELGTTLGEALLTPTKIYVKPLLALISAIPVKAVCHITGGGFYENIPRCLPHGLCARIEEQVLRIPPIFPLLQKEGRIPKRDMFNTYNMGVGMAVVVAAEHARQAIAILQGKGEQAYALGEIVQGEEGVLLC
ncbi:MAG: phosphoribosylformylglycinamidine cyclo-ligase [Clostridiales bacterium]|nr:phosphoribosylformylglycinamidine cyclo-ligase [Clostridiales bacterium]